MTHAQALAHNGNAREPLPHLPAELMKGRATPQASNVAQSNLKDDCQTTVRAQTLISQNENNRLASPGATPLNPHTPNPRGHGRQLGWRAGLAVHDLPQRQFARLVYKKNRVPP